MGKKGKTEIPPPARKKNKVAKLVLKPLRNIPRQGGRDKLCPGVCRAKEGEYGTGRGQDDPKADPGLPV